MRRYDGAAGEWTNDAKGGAMMEARELRKRKWELHVGPTTSFLAMSIGSVSKS